MSNRKLAYEMGISDMLSHRLAKKFVMENIKSDDSTYFVVCELYIAECVSVLKDDFELPQDQIDRITMNVAAKAESERRFFEKYGKFRGHGADQFSLVVVLEGQIELLKAM